VSQFRQRVVPCDSLFKCQSLEELVLKNWLIIVPPLTSLSYLTTLQLSKTTVICCDSKDLTLKFPVLRKFEIEGGFPWSTNIKSVTLHAPILKVVSMDYGSTHHWSNAEIKFCASRLTKFCYAGSFLSEIILLDAVHIISANIRLYSSKKSIAETMHFVSKLLSINAARLKLCVHSKKVCFLSSLFSLLFWFIASFRHFF